MLVRARLLRDRGGLRGLEALGVLKAEVSAEKHTRGAVSAVLQPGRPDSGGAQFFVCVTDQAALQVFRDRASKDGGVLPMLTAI